MIATLLSQKEKTAGLILLGGAGICMKDALLYQNRRAAAEFQKKKGLLGWLLHKQTTEEKTNAKVDVMFKKCMESGKDALFFGGATLNAKWIREHSSYTSKDFTDLLKQYPNPVLAITGTEDLSTDYMALCHRLNSAASLYNVHLSKNDKNEVDNLNKNRNWTVLFIGGASGTGKSSLAYEIARFYGVNVLEVDDIHLSVETVTTKEEFPAIHYWKTDIDWKNIGVNGNVNWLIDVSKEIAPVLKELANRHIEDKLPIIIEGDFISPEFTASFNNPEIKSIFMKESDKNQILRNYLSREGGDLQNYRADISVAYGDCLSDTCGKSGIKMIDSRPWSTALSRAIESLL